MSDFPLLHSALHGLGVSVSYNLWQKTSNMHNHALMNQLTVGKDGDLVFDGILEYQLVLANHLSH